MRVQIGLAAALAILGWLAAPARAGDLTVFEYRALITAQDLDADGNGIITSGIGRLKANVGVEVSGQFSFRNDQPDRDYSDERGEFILESFTLLFPTSGLGATVVYPGQESKLAVERALTGHHFSSDNYAAIEGVGFASTILARISFAFGDSTATAFASDELPTALSLAQFDRAALSLYRDVSEAFRIDAEISYLARAPEPQGISLAVAALSMMLAPTARRWLVGRLRTTVQRNSTRCRRGPD